MTGWPVRRSAGFSLVELMIAMTLGLILVGGVITMYLSSKRTMHTTQASSQIQEVSRFALDRISFDVRMSGFWGCISNAVPVNSTLNPSTSLIDFAAGPLMGTNNDGVNGSDSLSLAYAQGQAQELLSSMLATSSPLEIDAGNGFAEGDLLVANDCEQVDVFQVNGRDPADPGRIFHVAAGSAIPGNAQANLSKAYSTGAQLHKVAHIHWSLGTGGQGQPVLLRNDEVFVDGVEDLQIAYGVDLDGDGSVNRYVDADAVTNWNSVLNLKLGLLIRSDKEVADDIAAPFMFWGEQITPNDNFMRRHFSVVISVRNHLS